MEIMTLLATSGPADVYRVASAWVRQVHTKQHQRQARHLHEHACDAGMHAMSSFEADAAACTQHSRKAQGTVPQSVCTNKTPFH
jgi:hypothetical protein